MAYTHGVFKTTVPSGKADGGSLLGHYRRLRTEIKERMQDFLSGWGDWTADPVVSTATRYAYYHWSAWKGIGLLLFGFNGARTITAEYGIPFGSGEIFRCPILLPRGAVIQDIHITCRTDPGITITWALRSNDNTTTTVSQTTHSSGTIPSNTTQQNYAAVTSLGLTIDATPATIRYYFFEVASSFSGGQSFGGIRIRYTVSGVKRV